MAAEPEKHPAAIERLGKRGLRSDAAANRASLIAAAGAMMRAFGADVSLEAIAERAGTTRGTMYRNFADRQELYLAVLDDDLRRIAERLSRRRKADLAAVMQELSDMMVVYDRFLAALPDLDDLDRDTTSDDRIFVLIEEPLRRAQAAGQVRGELTAADILLACRMIAAGWHLDRAKSRKAALDRRTRIVMQGLGPRCRAMTSG